MSRIAARVTDPHRLRSYPELRCAGDTVNAVALLSQSLYPLSKFFSPPLSLQRYTMRTPASAYVEMIVGAHHTLSFGKNLQNAIFSPAH